MCLQKRHSQSADWGRGGLSTKELDGESRTSPLSIKRFQRWVVEVDTASPQQVVSVPKTTMQAKKTDSSASIFGTTNPNLLAKREQIRIARL